MCALLSLALVGVVQQLKAADHVGWEIALRLLPRLLLLHSPEQLGHLQGPHVAPRNQLVQPVRRLQHTGLRVVRRQVAALCTALHDGLLTHALSGSLGCLLTQQVHNGGLPGQLFSAHDTLLLGVELTPPPGAAKRVNQPLVHGQPSFPGVRCLHVLPRGPVVQCMQPRLHAAHLAPLHRQQLQLTRLLVVHCHRVRAGLGPCVL
mmetsp:Transcript_25640/g.55832  ORF Transcript_25640/g.55832 Transcript_25640/m.55832 type:complete len:205 (-) Transcript_25640:287-901(-)